MTKTAKEWIENLTFEFKGFYWVKIGDALEYGERVKAEGVAELREEFAIEEDMCPNWQVPVIIKAQMSGLSMGIDERDADLSTKDKRIAELETIATALCRIADLSVWTPEAKEVVHGHRDRLKALGGDM